MGTKHPMSPSLSCPIELHLSHRSFILSCATIDLGGIQVAFHFPWDSYDVAPWHLFLLLPQWCFVLHPCGGATMHNRETQIWFKCFLACNWRKKLVVGVLFTRLSFGGKVKFNVSSQHDSPTHKHLFRNLVSWICKGIFLSIFMHCRWNSQHRSIFYYIIYIWTFSNWTLFHRTFNPTS
jgi:hypothetical protein